MQPSGLKRWIYWTTRTSEIHMPGPLLPVTHGLKSNTSFFGFPLYFPAQDIEQFFHSQCWKSIYPSLAIYGLCSLSWPEQVLLWWALLAIFVWNNYDILAEHFCRKIRESSKNLRYSFNGSTATSYSSKLKAELMSGNGCIFFFLSPSTCLVNIQFPNRAHALDSNPGFGKRHGHFKIPCVVERNGICVPVVFSKHFRSLVCCYWPSRVMIQEEFATILFFRTSEHPGGDEVCNFFIIDWSFQKFPEHCGES